ncbi:hypothetical protein B0T16DRAFT_459038 [Cercophora newfieldiana]|uniref:Uncharacterized protein n=1 Tax=Cercophora newfieldiana TaxID=92897 RepID=A0AA39Y8X2_9PEZI|nr:hypothetical protein B0T16DRAFT_459038 [Cercophora newfieldiana]
MDRKTQRSPSPPASEKSPEEPDASHQRHADARDSRLVRREFVPTQENSLQEPVGEQQIVQHDNGRGGAPAVRLDMDLDVDLQMKAKIQGDLTLSILEGDQKPTSDKGHSTKALEG